MRGKDLGDDPKASVAAFTRAIDQDPKFDLAYLYRGTQSWKGDLNDQVAAYTAEEDLRRALELDPDLPEAHEDMGRVLAFMNQDYEEALIHVDRAIAIAGCDGALESWDYDCGQYVLARAQVMIARGSETDLADAEHYIEQSRSVIALKRRRESISNDLLNARVNVALLHGTCTNGDETVIPCAWSTVPAATPAP